MSIKPIEVFGRLSITYAVSRLFLVILQVFAYLGSSISRNVLNHED